MPQHLTKDEGRATILEAHANGRLQAQVAPGACLYEDDGNGCCCAVGVNLNRLTLDRIHEADANEDTSVQALATDLGIITVDDLEWWTKVQDAHDRWSLGEGSEEAFLEAVRFVTQHLTVSEGRAKILEAHANKQLLAQRYKSNPHNRCLYRDPHTGCGCAVGVCLDGPTLAAVLAADKNETNVWSLEKAGLVKLEASWWWDGVQTAHDAWLQGNGSEEEFLGAVRA